jgi:hypothetical protein
MAGVYGDMLAAFPELMSKYEVFKMNPRTGAGYGERYDRRAVRGYMSWRKAREAEIIAGSFVKNDRGTFWERGDPETGGSLIELGDLVEIKGVLYRFVEGDDFTREGRFSRWTVQMVAGNTDKQVPDSAVRLGAEDF